MLLTDKEFIGFENVKLTAGPHTKSEYLPGFWGVESRFDPPNLFIWGGHILNMRGSYSQCEGSY